MTVKAAVEKNFRRAQVKPAKRKSGRPWLSWRLARIATCGALVLYSAYRALDLAVSASTLQVRHITVEGHAWLSTGEVQALVDGLRGSSILTADLAGYRERLLQSPWVADVALRRVLPSTVQVFVSERRPVGLCRLRTQLYLIDRGGTVIDEFGPQYAAFDLPIIDGLLRVPASGEPVIDERRADLAARVIDAVAASPAIAKRLSQIDVSDVHNAVVMLDGDPALLRIGEDRFLQRLQSYVELQSAYRTRFPDIDYVDLRFGDRVYVRPAAMPARQQPRHE